MKLYKSNSLIEEINNVGEFDKGLKGIAEVDFADAVIRTRDKEKEINDTLEKHFTKELKEIDNTEKDRTEPHKVTSPDLKKMHLSEALFEDWEEDEEEVEIDSMYHDASEDELRKMGAFDNLNEDSDEAEWELKNDLNSKVYNALSDIAFYYHGKGTDLTEKDFEQAWEWFAIHFADEAEWSFKGIEESVKGKSGKTNLADKLRAKLRAKKESMINEDLVIIAGVEDFKPSSELAQKVLDIVMQNDKLGEFDQICEKMFPEGAKSEDINDVLESEDGKWVMEMLDLDPNALTNESETVEVTDDEVEA